MRCYLSSWDLTQDDNMRLTAMASAIFAVAGTTPNLVRISDGALSAPEPMWLALWGLALIGFSSSLRARVRVHQRELEVARQVAATQRDYRAANGPCPAAAAH